MISAAILLSASQVCLPCAGNQAWSSSSYLGQPVVRRFELRTFDESRRLRWEVHGRRLDELWAEYRAAGSTEAAFEKYRRAAAEAKRRYIEAEPYFVPVYP